MKKYKTITFSFLIVGLFMATLLLSPAISTFETNALAESTTINQINIIPDINFMQSKNSTTRIDLNITGIAYGHELIWQVNTTGTNYEESAVTYLDGIAYVGSCSTHGAGHDQLFAINVSTGEILWSFPTGPGYVGPVIDEDIIYIGTDSHGHDPENEYMYAINRYTGQEIWNRKIFNGIPESVQYDDEKIYFCSNTIYALNKQDGSINWTYDMGSLCVTKPMLKDGHYYTASSGGRLYKIDASNGKRIWSMGLANGPWDNSITSDNKGRLYLGIYYDRSLNAYDEEDGSLLWRYELHSGPLSFNAYHDGVVFIADTKGYVYAIHATDGTLIWENKIGHKIDISSPTISNGLLFIGTRDSYEGAFFVLNETTGKILWKYPVGASVTAPPSIADGMMFCATDGWDTYAFDFGIGVDDWVLHRYDPFNTAYSPNGLTSWQYVKAICTTKNEVTICEITNYYDHEISQIHLYFPDQENVYWYDTMGNILTQQTNQYVMDYLESETTKNLILSPKELHPPNQPLPPNGPTSGAINIEYSYTTQTQDPDQDTLYYLFDWGDETPTEWLGPFTANESCTASHQWTKRDEYNIKVKARDESGLETPWSEPLEISMPKNNAYPSLKMTDYPAIYEILQSYFKQHHLPYYNLLTSKSTN